MPPHFIDAPPQPFHEGERSQLADMAWSNTRRLLKELSGDILPLASTFVGIVTAVKTGSNEDDFVILVESTELDIDLNASSADELKQLSLDVLGMIWKASNDVLTKESREKFTGKTEELAHSAPLPSTDPDDPTPFDDPFNEGVVPTPAFLTEKS